jgi:hypothetical protein
LLLLALADIFSRMPCLGAELGEGFVLGNKHSGWPCVSLYRFRSSIRLLNVLYLPRAFGACTSSSSFRCRAYSSAPPPPFAVVLPPSAALPRVPVIYD